MSMLDQLTTAGAAPARFGAASYEQDGVLAGIPVTNVLAGATASVTVNVPDAMQIRKIGLGTARASFDVLDLVIGVTSQQLGVGGAIPGDLFVGNNKFYLRGNLLKPGVGVRFDIINTTGAAANFDGAIFGPALKKRR